MEDDLLATLYRNYARLAAWMARGNRDPEPSRLPDEARLEMASRIEMPARQPAPARP